MHLRLDAFKAWIEELARLLRPGGVALFTINSGAALAGALGKSQDFVERVLRLGFDDATHGGETSDVIDDKDYVNRATYVTHDFARDLFSKSFRIRDIVLQANASAQDMVVCERL